MAYTVFIQVLILSLEILVGYVLGKRGFLTAEHSGVMTRLVLDVFFPCSVVASTSNDFGEGGMAKTFAVMGLYFVMLYVFYGVAYGVATLMKLDSDERRVFGNSAGYPNNGFMGLPLCTAVFGSQGTLWAALTIPGTTMYISSMLTPTLRRKKDGEQGFNWRSLVTPLNVAVVIMLVMILLGIRLTGPLYTVISSFGGCVTPIAMLLIGYMLSASPLIDALKRPAVYAITIVRNIVCPLLGAVALSFTSWDRQMCLCLVTVMGCSVAATVSIFASRYDRAPSFASQCMLQSTVLLPITMPVMMFFAEKILM